ncbi:alpha-L-fucosidase [Pararhodonellum marinum]|uniref:alpha-L-fucosidase n=1 Tax=Pararhodonellum marinum TaxID=2755358 RepID=UPI00188E02C7|nr:alpha-L-fucosidase [Pararhodonellum marinum]
MTQKRRDFLKYAGLGFAGSMIPAVPSWARGHAKSKPDKTRLFTIPEPNNTQREWMDLEFGMFVHFGINTYYDTEWSDGTLDPIKFNPSELDTDQWCQVAVAAGMKYIVLITKHHDGFCLWPSKYTDYSVKSSPYKGDLVKELVNSARKYGLKVGLYYSLWDRHETSHDTDDWAYVEFMKNQIAELLTDYGPIVELWFDGFWKKQKSGWTSKNEIEGEKVEEGGITSRAEDFIHAWRMEGAYRWQMDHLYQFIKNLQPDCLIMNNATTAYPGVPLHPVDIRSGEKYTEPVSDQKIWTWQGRDIYLPMQIETTMSTKGNKQFPSGNWFWHEWDHSVASKSQIHKWLDTSRKMQANLLLNVGPMDTGKLRPEDVAVLSSLQKS